MAISKYIKPPTSKTKEVKIFSAEECAISFLTNLENKQKEKFKCMIENGAEIGVGISKSYNVSHDEFMEHIYRLIKE
ncbi:MAG: hypothetical protein RR806_08390 [Oscillospiraceae bacterium]